jgi:hypothetical protein
LPPAEHSIVINIIIKHKYVKVFALVTQSHGRQIAMDVMRIYSPPAQALYSAFDAITAAKYQVIKYRCN